MPLLSASLDTFLFTSLVTLGPWLYYSSRQPQPLPRLLLTALLVVHSLFILYNLTVATPQNIFSSLHLPLTTPPEKIRRVLLKLGDIDALPHRLDTLLSRLSSFDARTLYIRFGHTVVQDCEHCHSYNDFALYALPRPLLEYVREAAVLGAVTLRGSGRERWRAWGLGVLLTAAAFEAYRLSSAEIKLPQPGETTTMWHDVLWRARQALFLFLPITLHHLPETTPAPVPLSALPSLVQRAEATLARLHLLKYARGAGARVPALRAAAEAWWGRERREGAWGAGDARVQDMAARLGLGDGVEPEGPLRTSARMFADGLKKALVSEEPL